MAQIELSPAALKKLDQIDAFYAAQDTQMAERALSAIFNSLRRIAERPLIGRPYAGSASGRPELREMIVPFGRTGFIILYSYDRERQMALILAIRHQREAGFGEEEV